MSELINKIKINILIILFNIIFNLKLKSVFSYLFNLSVRKIQRSHIKSKIKILILEKNFFNSDMMSCFEGHPEFEVYGLDRKILKLFFYKFLPLEIDENNYLSNQKKIINGKKKLRKLWIDILKKVNFFDIVFTGNYSYFAEQEFAAACKINGIKFIALHKETLNTPKLSKFFEWVFSKRKNKFLGDYILVYNNIGKQSLINSKVISSRKIFVSGMPRLDPIILKKKKLGKKIVLFSTEEKTGLPEIGRKIINREKLQPELEKLSFEKITYSLHKSFIELAKEHKDIEFIIKGKNIRSSFNYLDKLLKKTSLPSNLVIDYYTDVNEILNQSRVVTGLYTTAIFEALAAKIPIVVPKYYEALESGTKEYYLYIKHNIYYAKNEKLFKKMMIYYYKNYDKFPFNDNYRKKTLQHWLGNSDGRSGERVRRFVKNICK